MKIAGQNFNIIDTLNSPVTVPDCFAMRASKIGGGNGEAKLYIASKAIMYPFFGKRDLSQNAFIEKRSLSYMNALHSEYLHPHKHIAEQMKCPVYGKNVLLKSKISRRLSNSTLPLKII